VEGVSKNCPRYERKQTRNFKTSSIAGVKYHIRQGIDPKKDPIVMVQIRELMKAGTINHGESLKDFQKRMPTQYQTLSTTIAKECFNDVIPRFHNVHGAAITPEIFRYAGTVGRVGDNVELTNASRNFLLVYKN
jgi:hypothetical protein